MDETDWLAERFETHRRHLQAVAYRMLGSSSEAEDAVQEAWLRLSRSDAGGIDNLAGWLTTVVARVCLNMLQSRRSRREESLDAQLTEPVVRTDGAIDPEQEAVLADSVGLALLVVLDTLSPAERVAFVLHDMFGVPFEEVAPIVDRSAAATRQLASRARRRVQGAAPVPDRARQRRVVGAFLAASRGGDFEALLAVLDPEVVLRADRMAVAAAAANAAQGAPQLVPEVRGAAAVADAFAGRAQAARLALVDGVVGAAWVHAGQTRVVFAFTVRDDRVTEMALIADPERIAQLDVELL
jgi:RNA polymerase sigma factor (sigma-70 family)